MQYRTIPMYRMAVTKVQTSASGVPNDHSTGIIKRLNVDINIYCYSTKGAQCLAT